MPLYCYIIYEGEYDYVETHIIGHKNKYPQKEFDNICIEVMAKYGKVKEENITVPATLEKYDRIVYTIHPQKLIEHLVSDYGFVELDVPYNEGFKIRRLPNPQPKPEGYVRYVVRTPECPFGKGIK